MSSQGMFDSALQIERRWGLNLWDEECPWNTSVTFTLGQKEAARKDVEWTGRMQRPFQSIDQRLKFSRWLDIFQGMGGRLVIQSVALADLDEIANGHELTVVASGKGEIGQCFLRDQQRSMFDRPQRTLACMYVTGMLPAKDSPGVRINVVPGVGEYITMPGLTLNGHCEMMLFEGIPGRAFDVLSEAASVEEQLRASQEILARYLPWEAQSTLGIELADRQATLRGSYTPCVKHPTARMSSGKFVLGMADTVVLNDPIAGQGANTAVKSAAVYFDRIVGRDKAPFDEYWMRETFEQAWRQCAQASTEWSNLLLSSQARHVDELLRSASSRPGLADKLAEGFDDANKLFPWIIDPIQTRRVMDCFE